MREIKFKFHVAGHGMSRAYTLCEINDITYLHFRTISDVVINLSDPMTTALQYTGLKDHRGVEIFEGDILKIMGGMLKMMAYQVVTHPDDGAVYSEARFNYGGFIVDFEGKNINCGLLGWVIGLADSVEIIGNKFENPELLAAI